MRLIGAGRRPRAQRDLGGSMKDMVSWLADEESGQGLVEYALILALIAIVVITALTLLGNNVNNKFDKINNAL